MIVLDNDFHGEVASTHTYGLDGDNLVLFDLHLLEAVTVIVSVHTIVLGTRQYRLTDQQFASLVNIAQIGQRRNALVTIAVVIERAQRQFKEIVLTVVLAMEHDTLTTVGSLLVALIGHDAMAQATVANFLGGRGIAESVDQQVVFLGNHHEAHAFTPVAHAVETEVLAHEVGRFCLLLLGCAIAGGSLDNGFLDTFGLYDVVAADGLGRSFYRDNGQHLLDIKGPLYRILSHDCHCDESHAEQYHCSLYHHVVSQLFSILLQRYN